MSDSDGQVETAGAVGVQTAEPVAAVPKEEGHNSTSGVWRAPDGLTSPENFMDYDHNLLPLSPSVARWQLETPLPIQLVVHIRTPSPRAVGLADQLVAVRFAGDKLRALGHLSALRPEQTHWWLASEDLVVHVYAASSSRSARSARRRSIPCRLEQLARQLAAPPPYAAEDGRTWSAAEPAAVSAPTPSIPLPHTHRRRRRRRQMPAASPESTDSPALPPPLPDPLLPPSTFHLPRTTPRAESGRVFGLRGSTRRPRRSARRDRDAQRLATRRVLRRSLTCCIAMPEYALQLLLAHSIPALAFRPRLIAACILSVDVHTWIAGAPIISSPTPTSAFDTAVAAAAAWTSAASQRVHDAALVDLRCFLTPFITAATSLHTSRLARQLHLVVKLTASVPVAEDDFRARTWTTAADGGGRVRFWLRPTTPLYPPPFRQLRSPQS